jgi:hypothetical protein
VKQRAELTLTALLVLSLLVNPVAAQDADSQSADWPTLAPSAEAIDRANHTTVGTDLSAVVQRDGIRLVSRHRQATLDVEQELAPSDTAQFDQLTAEIGQIDDKLDELAHQQNTLITQFSEGRIGEKSMLTGIATVGVHAGAIEHRLLRIRAAGRSVESRGLIRRANDKLARVEILQGTVRANIAARQRGAEEGGRIYAEAANRSLAMATATEQDYLREVSIPDHRSDRGTTIGLSNAVSIVSNAYPELYTARQSIEVGGSRRVGFYRVGIAGTGEFLTAYVDADNRAVFRESRRVSLARVPLNVGPNTTVSGYHLATETTYRGGPMRITVEQTDGEPVDAQIALGDRAVGSTGNDGRIWVTAPARTTVNARIDGMELSVPLEPPSPQPLNTTES